MSNNRFVSVTNSPTIISNSSKTCKYSFPLTPIMAGTLFLICNNDLLNLNVNGSISVFANWVFPPPLSLCLNLVKLRVNIDETRFINFDQSGFVLPFKIKYNFSACDIYLCNCQTIDKVSYIKILLSS